MNRTLTKAELDALKGGRTGTKEELEQELEEDKSVRVQQRMEILSENPTYDSIGGYQKQKEELSFVGNVARNSQVYQDSYDQIPNRGIYLVGPNGVGKTMMVRALIRQQYEELHKEDDNLEILLRGDYLESMLKGDQSKQGKIAEGIGKVKDKISKPSNKTFYYDIIDASQLVGQMPQVTEKIVREYFERAASADYAVVVLDRIEGLLPAESQNGQSSQVGHLLDMVRHYIEKNPNLIVIGTTSKPSKVDNQVSSVLTKRIEMGAPDETDRKDIIEVCIDGQPIEDDFKIEELVKQTAGYVGSDIANICDEAIKSSSKRNGLEQKISQLKQKFGLKFKDTKDYKTLIESQGISMVDFKEALSKVKPSLLLGYTIESPDVKLEDIAGLDEIKQDTKLWMNTRMSNPWIYEACGLSATSNRYWLLVGPPGTGKTLYAKALAGEDGATFISVKGGEVLDKWVGSTEQNIREIFKRAREAKKAVIFWDEIDAMATKRGSGQKHDDDFVTALLAELEGVTANENIVFISATNRPDQLDPAFMSRMNRMIYVGLPEAEQIKDIIKINLGLTENPRHRKNAPKQVHPDVVNGLDGLAAVLEERDFSGRDVWHLIAGAKEEMAKRLSELVSKGADQATIESACMLTMEDISKSLEEITPRTYDDAYWNQMAKEYKLTGYKSKKK